MLLNDKEIQFLPGVGPKRASLLQKELEIFTFNDLLYHFPFRHIDKTKFYKVNEITEDLPYIQSAGIITNFRTSGQGRRKRMSADFKDETGSIKLVWFKGLAWIQNNIKPGHKYIIFGKATVFNNLLNIAHPEIETIEKYQEQTISKFEGVYPTTEKLKTNFLNSNAILKLQRKLIELCKDEIVENLPSYILQKYKLMSLKDALINIHFPKDPQLLKNARFRLKFDELFFIQLKMLKTKAQSQVSIKGIPFKKVGSLFNEFYEKHLPFELTEAQKKVIREIRTDLGSGKQCNRLLQGDVGSGKTLVALMSMLIALDNDYQTCIMAPTEILAMQHFHTVKEFLSEMDVNVQLLTGSTKQKDRRVLHEDLKNGKIQILIGTHALIEDTVKFKNLGLAVVDEQHRFGVVQRAKLWKKNKRPPHIIVMTATPIPRTLAMTVYGDLDVSIIDELPPGRKPVKTLHYYDSQRLRVFESLRKQIAEGRQVYIVYPLIQESEAFDYKDLEDGLESISRAFPPPQYAISVVHGKMKSEEKEKSMQYFVKGITNIMIATTVIEVGVNVPNASVMLIESAERFGLSQLHQLRGRVGRGADQSYCILMTSFKLSKDAKTRIETMVETNDGFKIAETDMKLRGFGDIEGTQQSGIPFNLKISNLARDGEIISYARKVADEVIANDPELKLPENSVLNSRLKTMFGKDKNWSIVS